MCKNDIGGRSLSCCKNGIGGRSLSCCKNGIGGCSLSCCKNAVLSSNLFYSVVISTRCNRILYLCATLLLLHVQEWHWRPLPILLQECSSYSLEMSMQQSVVISTSSYMQLHTLSVCYCCYYCVCKNGIRGCFLSLWLQCSLAPMASFPSMMSEATVS